MIELNLNWRFCVLAILMVIIIIQQVIARRELKVFDLIKVLISDNTKTNEKLTETLDRHNESMREQSQNIIEFEKTMGKEIAELRGALSNK